jgi:hypothetical protein
MDTMLHPVLADLVGYAEAMNGLHFFYACALAVVALAACLLPRRWKVFRWTSIGLALASVSIVVHLELPSVNDPPWRPVWVMMWPVLASVAATVWSLRLLKGR